MPRAISTFSSGCALLTLFACSDPERDLGQTSDDPANAMQGSECDDSARAGELQAPRATFLSDFVGLWLGVAEDALGDANQDDALPIYAFPSGSTRIVLEVSHPGQITATLTFGEGEPPFPRTDAYLRSPPDPDFRAVHRGADDSPPIEGFAYSAEPSALDAERSGGDEDQDQQLALDGMLVLAFSIDDVLISELLVRLTGNGLVGVFDGLTLVNERGYLTRPGRVRFRPADLATRPSSPP